MIIENNKKLKLYDKTFNEIIKPRYFLNNYNGFLVFMVEFQKFIYDLIHNEYEPDHLENQKHEIEIRKLCKYVSEEVYPKFNEIRLHYLNPKKNKNIDNTIKDIFNRIEDDLYSIMALRSLRHFAFYMDRDTLDEKKVWENGTMAIFENFFFYANKMILTGNMDLIQASYFPGAGKSYAGDLLTAYWLGYRPITTFLRVTYDQTLTEKFVKGTTSLIESERFKKVFKQFDMPKKELFSLCNKTQLQLSLSKTLNLVGTTCLGKGTGLRAEVVILDDVVKGVQDAYNVSVQERVVNMYDYEWTSRADNGKQKVIALGTMWSYYDILNVIKRRALKNGVYKDKRFKYTLCDKENPIEVRKIFISTPLLDYETDESTCPLRYPTSYCREKRDESENKDIFEAVYQQNPQEPPQYLFAYSRLNTGLPPENIRNYQTIAFIDPVREGLNFFSMPIARRFLINGEWTKWYLIDVIYKFETNDICLPFVIEKILLHDIEWLGYEKNVDGSYTKLIKQQLTRNGYTGITIKSIYTTQKKQDKISVARNGIINEVIYPPQGVFSPKSEMGTFMTHLTTWEYFGKVGFDDAPDSMAMLIQENPTAKKNHIKAVSAIPRIF